MKVHCDILFSQAFAGDFSFKLSSELELEACSADGLAGAFTSGEPAEEVFRAPLVTPYTLTGCSEVRLISFDYRGPVRGWCNLLTPAVKALSLYSAWSPFDLKPAPDGYTIFLDAPAQSRLIKGEQKNGQWVYQRDDIDPCQLLLLDMGQYHCVENDLISVYFQLGEEEAAARDILRHYDHVLRYYEHELYWPKEREHADLVSLSLAENEGAYRRRDLIVASRLPESADGFVVMLAHELAHDWCTGADTESWEDWLNETSAEWSALLYLAGADPGHFARRLTQKTEDYQKFPPIQTSDGSRPEGTHERGVALFGSIYRQKGADCIKRLLQIFAGLEQKDTEHFLAAVEAADPSSAQFIRNNLTAVSYE